MLSIVVVIHREQAHVEQCVRSVLDQGFADVELVAVDDASPDHAPRLLDRLARDEPRLEVVHLPSHVGADEAAAAGLAAARHEYVWFMDVADVLAPGALAGVAERLASEKPDVLLVHHVREDALGRRKRGPAPRSGPAAFDKIIRRDLATHEPWVALLTAQRVATDPEPRYVRRSAPSIDARRRREAPDFFVPYDRAFAVGAQGDAVATEMLRNGLARKDYKRLFPGLAERLQDRDVEGLEAQLVRRGNLAAYEALRAARARKAALGRRKAALAKQRRRVTAAGRRRELARHYESERRKPIDPDLAVFGSFWFRNVSDNPGAIYEKARELVPGMRGVWVVNDGGYVPDGVEHVRPRTREYFDAIARARYLVNNVNFPDHLVKRDGTLHVMTHHGTPLKRMGLDLRDTQIAGQRMDFDALLRRARRWDFSISSNPLSSVVWERVFPVPCETLEVGYPRNDRLANGTPDEVARLRTELEIPDGARTVLYAPTHREYRASYTPTLDLARTAAGLGDDHVLLARLHYFYGADPVLRRLHDEGRVRDVSAHPSIEDLCLAADVLVTDYSSLMFDYAVLDRPIVIHAPDWEVYVAMRGTYFDLMAEPPGAVARTDEETVAAILAGDPAPQDRAAFREQFCAWDDGRASERVVRRVWFGEAV